MIAIYHEYWLTQFIQASFIKFYSSKQIYNYLNDLT